MTECGEQAMNVIERFNNGERDSTSTNPFVLAISGKVAVQRDVPALAAIAKLRKPNRANKNSERILLGENV